MLWQIWVADGICLFGCWMFFASSWVITSRNVFQNELGLILNVDEITDPVWQGLCFILKTAVFVFRKIILRLFRAQEKTSSHLLNFCEGKHKATFCWSSLILIFHGSHPRNVYLYYLNVLIVLRFVLLNAWSILFFSPLKKLLFHGDLSPS